MNGGTVKRNRLLIISTVIVVAAALPLILLNTVLANHQPVITSLEAAPQRVLLSESADIACNASDPDGDELSYEWSATGGDISGTGPEVTWTAPEETGIYDVTAVVRDEHGAEDTKSIVLSVATGTLPTIEDLIVTADHEYLKETATGYKVGKIQEYYIECVALNISGELVYEWSCDGGEISGEGSLMTWNSPDIESDVTVTVLVTDVAGNSVSESIILNVVRCSACIFG